MKNLITLERFNEITNKFNSLAPVIVVGDEIFVGNTAKVVAAAKNAM